jgi:uncharacterized membrane protein
VQAFLIPINHLNPQKVSGVCPPDPQTPRVSFIVAIKTKKIIFSKRRVAMEQQNQPQQPAPEASQASSADAEKNKAMGIVGYIVPILFFLPLISEAKDSPFAKFHANQQLLLLITWMAVSIVGGIIPFLGWFVPLGSICCVVLMVMGIINASKGELKELPVIGGISILK